LSPSGTKHLLSLLAEFAIALYTKHLPQEPKSRKEHQLFAVDTERETKASFIEKLKNLNDVLG
jgi:hypothetical protein